MQELANLKYLLQDKPAGILGFHQICFFPAEFNLLPTNIVLKSFTLYYHYLFQLYSAVFSQLLASKQCHLKLKIEKYINYFTNPISTGRKFCSPPPKQAVLVL